MIVDADAEADVVGTARRATGPVGWAQGPAIKQTASVVKVLLALMGRQLAPGPAGGPPVGAT